MNIIIVQKCVHLKDDFHIVSSMIAQMTDEEVQTLQHLEVFMKTTLW